MHFIWPCVSCRIVIQHSSTPALARLHAKWCARMKRETNKWLRTECRFSTKHSINKFAEHHRFLFLHIIFFFLPAPIFFLFFGSCFVFAIRAIFHSLAHVRRISSFDIIFFACVKQCITCITGEADELTYYHCINDFSRCLLRWPRKT